MRGEFLWEAVIHFLRPEICFFVGLGSLFEDGEEFLWNEWEGYWIKCRSTSCHRLTSKTTIANFLYRGLTGLFQLFEKSLNRQKFTPGQKCEDMLNDKVISPHLTAYEPSWTMKLSQWRRKSRWSMNESSRPSLSDCLLKNDAIPPWHVSASRQIVEAEFWSPSEIGSAFQPILETLEQNNFQIEDGVDSAKASMFVTETSGRMS
jgi:hypothetical protein